jgi:hypothetical protein
MDMITADEVIRRIDLYFAGGALDAQTPAERARFSQEPHAVHT